jgi:hypothetical protein
VELSGKSTPVTIHVKRVDRKTTVSATGLTPLLSTSSIGGISRERHARLSHRREVREIGEVENCVRANRNQKLCGGVPGDPFGSGPEKGPSR